MSKENGRDGTGKSIVAVNFPTATTATEGLGGKSDGASCRGFVSSVDGSVKVLLTGMDVFVEIPVLAGVYNLFSVDTIYDDGAVAITNIMLFW